MSDPTPGVIFDRESARRIGETVRTVQGAGRTGAQSGSARFGPQPTLWAKITGSTSTGTGTWSYTWQQVVKTSAGNGGWTVKSGGLNSTDNGVAYSGAEEVTGGASQAIETGAVVPLHRVKVDGGATEWWIPAGGTGGGGSSETIGTAQYQIHQMVSDAEDGWDYGRFP